jgi:uncharacterized protein (DUF1330 family)
MRKNIQKWLTFVGGIVIGSMLTVSVTTALADHHATKAYLVVAGSVIDATGMEAYGAKAGPEAAKAGIKVLGRNSDIKSEHVLEGDWPYEGFLAVEEFSSMDALMGFWHSDDYQAAIKLREGKVKLDFVVAVPGANQ